MTLKSLRRVLIDTRYTIVAHNSPNDDAPERITVDYLSRDDEFSDALQRVNELEMLGARVQYISRNTPTGHICVDVVINRVVVPHGED